MDPDLVGLFIPGLVPDPNMSSQNFFVSIYDCMVLNILKAQFHIFNLALMIFPLLVGTEPNSSVAQVSSLSRDQITIE